MVGVNGPQLFLSPVCKAAPYPLDLIATAAAGHLLRHCSNHHLRLDALLHSCFKKLTSLDQLFKLKDKWCQSSLKLKGLNFLQLSNNDLNSTCSTSFSFFNGGGHGVHFGNGGMSNSKMSGNNPFNGRKWTNILLAANVLFYIVQLATQGKLLLWGAKINSLIDKGQFWRLATSSFLHANVGHLLINCYSLNSVGPTVEIFSGPKRFLAVYFASAIASSAMSYWFCRMPAVGASGAIFGLVGSVAVFVLRHKDIVGGGKEDLLHIAHVIALNMLIGILSKGIDNWGHLGGLIGGVAASWLIGPAWKHESTSWDGRRLFTDSAPLYKLFKNKRVPKQWK
ncbi:RHOMBOID-like protein 10, chloroplastic isoform X1 [Arachis duranensis]|uniref:RHOMBOID-like protein 10, chloroplastic isoform X1 n=1 Tax=Arachis duranensis TaxID=130453 RepID=A0A6P4BPQ5_ARADU|nr:RHOMBOID-like protein 10, chloroplastic isoform X1 [Arachis duranensis]